MTTNYNKGYCAICGEKADDWEETCQGVRVWVCDKRECHRAIDEELREELHENRYRRM